MINGYVNLITGKFSLLLLLAFTACMAVPWKEKGKKLSFHLNASWLPLGVLCLSYTLAAFTAEHKQAAVWGITGRNNGLMLLLACTALYWVVRRYAKNLPADWLTAVLAGTGCCITLLSLCNFFMLDPLGVYYTFLPEKGELFTGTLGNANFYGAFLCLCVPIAAQRLLFAYNRRSKLIWGAALVWLGLGLMAAGSDAGWLGAFLGVGLVCSRRQIGSGKLARLFECGAVWAVLCLGLGLLADVLPTRTALRTVSALLASAPMALSLAVLFGIGALALRKRPYLPAWRAVRLAACLLAAAAVLAFAAANLTEVPLGKLENTLRFSDSWGSNRGFVWSRLWQIWRDDLSLWQRFVGLGGDAVYYRLQIDNFADYARILNGAVFDSAHSEYLQHLLCGGILGLGAWVSFLFVHIRRGLQSRPGIAGAILGYAVQAAFSISMPGVLPLVFVLGALCWSENKPVQTPAAWQCAALLAVCSWPLCALTEIFAGNFI